MLGVGTRVRLLGGGPEKGYYPCANLQKLLVQQNTPPKDVIAAMRQYAKKKGWVKCRVLASPKISIVGSQRKLEFYITWYLSFKPVVYGVEFSFETNALHELIAEAEKPKRALLHIDRLTVIPGYVDLTDFLFGRPRRLEFLVCLSYEVDSLLEKQQNALQRIFKKRRCVQVSKKT